MKRTENRRTSVKEAEEADFTRQAEIAVAAALEAAAALIHSRRKTPAKEVRKRASGHDLGPIHLRMRSLRDWAGYGESQNEFADWLGVHQSLWNHIETGRREPSLKVAVLLRERLRVTLDWIYFGDRSGLTVEIDKSLPKEDNEDTEV